VRHAGRPGTIRYRSRLRFSRSSTLEAAARLDFPIERIVFEVTEGESIADHRKLVEVFREYSRLGFMTAIGACGIAWSERGLLLVQLPERSPEAARARFAGGTSRCRRRRGSR